MTLQARRRARVLAIIAIAAVLTLHAVVLGERGMRPPVLHAGALEAGEWPGHSLPYAHHGQVVDHPETWVADGEGLRVLPAWRNQVEDDLLLTALALAYTYNPEWRDGVAHQLAERGTRVEWADLPDDAAGQLQAAVNRIVISRRLQSESEGVVAAILSHESFHAINNLPHDAASCFAEEVAAFAISAQTWNSLPLHWRGRGEWARLLDGLVSAWQRDLLSELIAQDAAYRQQCGV